MSINTEFLHNQLISWYERNKRILPWRETRNPYFIWVSEIILQQTRVAQAFDYYQRFIGTFPTVQALAAATEEQVLRLWQGLGYYTRARNMHRAAQLMKDALPTTFKQWRALPGIGDYTAGAIASFAFDAPTTAVDGNVMRVIARLFDCEQPIDTTQGKKHFAQLANEILDTTQPRQWNQAIMEFGALFCTPTKPICDECPVKNICLAHKNHTVQLLPQRNKRKNIKKRYFSYTIFIDENRQTLIHQRLAKDIWHHLWEFVLEERQDAPNTPTLLQMEHVLTHQRIYATFDVRLVPQLPHLAGYKRVSLQHLNDYALSQLTLKALKKLHLLPTDAHFSQ